jgi:hypothetical protein
MLFEQLLIAGEDKKLPQLVKGKREPIRDCSVDIIMVCLPLIL